MIKFYIEGLTLKNVLKAALIGRDPNPGVLSAVQMTVDPNTHQVMFAATDRYAAVALTAEISAEEPGEVVTAVLAGSFVTSLVKSIVKGPCIVEFDEKQIKVQSNDNTLAADHLEAGYPSLARFFTQTEQGPGQVAEVAWTVAPLANLLTAAKLVGFKGIVMDPPQPGKKVMVVGTDGNDPKVTFTAIIMTKINSSVSRLEPLLEQFPVHLLEQAPRSASITP